MSWSVGWAVSIDGRDVSSHMRPFLEAIDVSDKDGTASDTCRLTFNDAEGQCALPRKKAKLRLTVDGGLLFEGVVDSVRSKGNRGQGMTLEIGAKGFDTFGKANEGQLWHLDDAPLSQALGKAAQLAGFSLQLDPAFAEMQRDYWAPDGASFIAFGERMARELGGTFKLRGTRAVLAKRGDGASATGAVLPTIVARRPGNLLDWTIEPFEGGRSFATTKVRFFDRASGAFRTEEVRIDGDGAEATNAVRSLAADQDQAKAVGDGRKADSERAGGGGSIKIRFDPVAQAEATVLVAGVRPGIDGSYRASGVNHRASRSGGASTSIELKQPQGEAGTDNRVPTPTTAPR